MNSRAMGALGGLGQGLAQVGQMAYADHLETLRQERLNMVRQQERAEDRAYNEGLLDMQATRESDAMKARMGFEREQNALNRASDEKNARIKANDGDAAKLTESVKLQYADLHDESLALKKMKIELEGDMAETMPNSPGYAALKKKLDIVDQRSASILEEKRKLLGGKDFIEPKEVPPPSDSGKNQPPAADANLPKAQPKPVRPDDPIAAYQFDQKKAKQKQADEKARQEAAVTEKNRVKADKAAKLQVSKTSHAKDLDMANHILAMKNNDMNKLTKNGKDKEKQEKKERK